MARVKGRERYAERENAISQMRPIMLLYCLVETIYTRGFFSLKLMYAVPAAVIFLLLLAVAVVRYVLLSDMIVH